ncbi:MAG: membrane protein [Candidatus Woesearchaeota archaeon]|nr:MAG: membrane protein [Candidatus Woesearchaeota archaeon]
MFDDFLLSYYFLSFIISWIMSVLIKSFLFYFKSRTFSFKEGLKNGGMPSSHSAVVSAITFSVYFKEGFSSAFFVSMVFSLIIVSDAFILRRNVGIQAEKLNILLEKSNQQTIEVVNGHTFKQVIAGIVLGFIVSYSLLFLI